MKNFSLEAVQKALERERIEAWLFYDFQGLDPIARRILTISPAAHLTRRWFYLVPQSGEPQKLVHRIETAALDHLPGKKHLYAGWEELNENLKRILSGIRKTALHYSPLGAIPYISRMDGGTLELVRKTGVEITGAGNLISEIESVLTKEQQESHFRAARALREIVDRSFLFCRKQIEKHGSTTEMDIFDFIQQEFVQRKLVTDAGPIVAAGKNSGDPHYATGPERSARIEKGTFLLIDLWARETDESAIYGDITWTGYVGEKVPDSYDKIFQIVRGGRDAAFALVKKAVEAKREIKGYEVDEAARKYIRDQGYGDQFVHRTGHNIGVDVHGAGTHMDNFETRDERKILPDTCFSIEPGIYLKEFGVRSEIDVVVKDEKAEATGQPIQKAIVPILA